MDPILSQPDAFNTCYKSIFNKSIPDVAHWINLLNIGSIRIYILMTGVVSNETNTYARMYIEEFILVDLDTLLHKVEVLDEWSHWEECCLIYTRNKGLRNVRIALRSQLTSES